MAAERQSPTAYVEPGVREVCARVGGATAALDRGLIVQQAPAGWAGHPDDPGRWLTPLGRIVLGQITAPEGDH